MDNGRFIKNLIFAALAALVLFGILSACFGIAAGIGAAATALMLIALYAVDYSNRCRAMKRFADEINAILHGDDRINLSTYCEGELSILRNEVAKLIVRLRAQAGELQKERSRLADSISDISHQLKTPLTSIGVMLHTLSSDLNETKRAECVMSIMRQLIRIEWLVSALLKSAKLDAGAVEFKPQTITLYELMRKAAEPIEIPMELNEQELVIDARGQVRADIAWLSEAVGNILKNCMEHTPTGGKIYVFASENGLSSDIVIRDTGEGIAEGDLPHIFERFYKSKNASESSVGIGLAIARSIIFMHNGTIKAANHPDGGAVFTIRLYKQNI